jgi:hypothetical protein
MDKPPLSGFQRNKSSLVRSVYCGVSLVEDDFVFIGTVDIL